MKVYGVSMPITGFVYVEVEAESEEDAKKAFYEQEITVSDVEEWDTCEEITRGNVFCGIINSMEIEEV